METTIVAYIGFGSVASKSRSKSEETSPNCKNMRRKLISQQLSSAKSAV